jgi:hypothetical protein
VGVPAAARAAPRAVLALAVTAPVALVVAFPAWVGAVLFLAVLAPADRWRAGPTRPSRGRPKRHGQP